MSDTSLRRLADVPLLQERPDFAVAVPPARRVAESPGRDDVDWGLVVTLRRRTSDEVAQAAQACGTRGDATRGRRSTAHGASGAEGASSASMRRNIVNSAICGRSIVSSATPSALEDAIFGFGRMQPLFTLPGAENVEIHGFDSVVAQYGDGHREALAPVADSDEELVEAVRFLGESGHATAPL